MKATDRKLRLRLLAPAELHRVGGGGSDTYLTMGEVVGEPVSILLPALAQAKERPR